CCQPGYTRRSFPSRLGAQDGAVSLPAQSSRSAPTLRTFRPAQPTHSAHSAHSVQVYVHGDKKSTSEMTLREETLQHNLPKVGYMLLGVSVHRRL
ncbi:hypothetical protein Dimus_006161, partial [Dionaea muscipula]